MLLIVLAFVMLGEPVRLQWDHDGVHMTRFAALVDDTREIALDYRHEGSQTWSAPMPVLEPGRHHIQILVCNGESCWPSDQIVRVTCTTEGCLPVK